ARGPSPAGQSRTPRSTAPRSATCRQGTRVASTGSVPGYAGSSAAEQASPLARGCDASDRPAASAAHVVCGILDRVMSEESTTPDLVELTRRQFEGVKR